MNVLEQQSNSRGVGQKTIVFAAVTRYAGRHNILRRMVSTLGERNHVVFCEGKSSLITVGATKSVGDLNSLPLGIRKRSILCPPVAQLLQPCIFAFAFMVSRCLFTPFSNLVSVSQPVHLGVTLLTETLSLDRAKRFALRALPGWWYIKTIVAFVAKAMSFMGESLKASNAFSWWRYIILMVGLHIQSVVAAVAATMTAVWSYLVALDTFLNRWLAHKKTVLGGFTIRQNDETAVGRLVSIISHTLGKVRCLQTSP